MSPSPLAAPLAAALCGVQLFLALFVGAAPSAVLRAAAVLGGLLAGALFLLADRADERRREPRPRLCCRRDPRTAAPCPHLAVPGLAVCGEHLEAG